MLLPNLSALPATGAKRNPQRWLRGQRRRGKSEPNTDPITFEDWRPSHRPDGDPPRPKQGWVLHTRDRNGKLVIEEDYLYDVDALATWLIAHGTSPATRRRADDRDMADCIAEANRIRAGKKLRPLVNPRDPPPPQDPDGPPLPRRQLRTMTPEEDEQHLAAARRLMQEREQEREQERARQRNAWRRAREAVPWMQGGEPMPPYWRDSERRAEERRSMEQRMAELREQQARTDQGR